MYLSTKALPHDGRAILMPKKEETIMAKENLLERAKELINEYCISRFEYEADFDSLDSIGLAYTTLNDEYEEDYEIQINADLINFAIKRYLNNVLINCRKYESLDELIEKELLNLNWDDLVFFSNEEVKRAGTHTEITSDCLREYFYPTADFERRTDNAIVDYAEIEIIPLGIKKLEANLERCGSPEGWDEEDWSALNNPKDDSYEHVIAYVHFDAGTDNFNKLFIEVVTIHDLVELDVDALINEEEKKHIIDAALESLHKWRGTNNMC